MSVRYSETFHLYARDITRHVTLAPPPQKGVTVAKVYAIVDHSQLRGWVYAASITQEITADLIRHEIEFACDPGVEAEEATYDWVREECAELDRYLDEGSDIYHPRAFDGLPHAVVTVEVDLDDEDAAIEPETGVPRLFCLVVKLRENESENRTWVPYRE